MTLVSLLGLMLTGAAVAAANSHTVLEISPGAPSLRFALPDAVYAAGSTPGFSHWQVTDSSGNAVDFAICEMRSQVTASTAVPLIAAPEIARLNLAANGQPRITLPPGARDPGSTRSWLLDLRETGLQIHTLHGLPAVAEIRRSPNLQQWSAPLSFEQDAQTLQIVQPGSHFLRLSLHQHQRTAPASLPASGLSQQQRSVHWYQPDATDDTRYSNDRRMPVMAARVRQQPASQVWRLFSRQGDWDAWKPHGRVTPGQADESIDFSAVTDPQWRVDGAAGVLELAHAAYELRLPRVQPTENLRLQRHPRPDFGPTVSCRSSEQLPAQTPRQIRALERPAEKETGAKSLRGYFLIILAGLAVLTYLLRRYRMHRRRR